MHQKKRLSAGQKKHTPLFPSLHTSYFLKQEAKFIISKNENRFRFGICTLLMCSVPILALAVCFGTFYFFNEYGLYGLTLSSQKLLFCTFAFCVLFSGAFMSFALYCGALRLAYTETKENCSLGVILYAVSTKKAFGKAFGEYLLFLISNTVISVFPVFCVMLWLENEKFDVTLGIIYTVCILTYLYLLCIINGVFVILSCLDGKKRIQRAVSLLKGHICEFIFLNIRLFPCAVFSVLSLGVLYLTHTAPLVYASYACFASYAEDVGAYGKILPKGIDTDEQ